MTWQIEKFIDLAENNAEEEYMKAYIEIFDEEFGIDEPHLKSWVKNIGEYDYKYDNPTEQEKYNNSLKNRHQENCNIIKEVFEKHEPMLADLFINYKRLSVHELVERYKDEKWFTGKKI